jgi:DNA-binding Xre family transcriptional regulator
MPRISPLKQEIVKRRLIQGDVAEAAYLSETRLSKIVNGRVRATDYERKNLANALDMSRDELPL